MKSKLFWFNLIKPEGFKKSFWYTSVFDHLTAGKVHLLLPLPIPNESKKDWEESAFSRGTHCLGTGCWCAGSSTGFTGVCSFLSRKSHGR